MPGLPCEQAGITQHAQLALDRGLRHLGARRQGLDRRPALVLFVCVIGKNDEQPLGLPVANVRANSISHQCKHDLSNASNMASAWTDCASSYSMHSTQM